MSGEAVVFWIFATLTVASAAVVVLSRTLIYSAFALLVVGFLLAVMIRALQWNRRRGQAYSPAPRPAAAAAQVPR